VSRGFVEYRVSETGIVVSTIRTARHATRNLWHGEHLARLRGIGDVRRACIRWGTVGGAPNVVLVRFVKPGWIGAADPDFLGTLERRAIPCPAIADVRVSYCPCS
jgi:hypothetical protein